MREDKCRGKIKYGTHKGQWVYGAYLDGYILKWVEFESDGSIDCRGKEVNPETVGRYTHLKDTAGVEAYEGDIVQVYFKEDSKEDFKEVMTVVWNEKRYRLQLQDLIQDFDEGYYDYNNTLAFKIIGNIHDNPELLEVK